jgi:hypothetical protein
MASPDPQPWCLGKFPVIASTEEGSATTRVINTTFHFTLQTIEVQLRSSLSSMLRMSSSHTTLEVGYPSETVGREFAISKKHRSPLKTFCLVPLGSSDFLKGNQGAESMESDLRHPSFYAICHGAGTARAYLP